MGDTMGSKTPPISRLPQDEPLEDEGLHRSGPTAQPAPNPLLQRIAEALQVPSAALYDLPNAVDTTSSAGVEDERVLLQAYRYIRDPAERRRLLSLVQEAAERT